MKIKNLLVCLIITLMFCVIGCSDPDPVNGAASIYGTWYGVPNIYDWTNLIVLVDEPTGDDTFTSSVYFDGVLEEVVSGTFTYDATTFTSTQTDPEILAPQVWSYILDGDTFTVTSSDELLVIIFTRQ